MKQVRRLTAVIERDGDAYVSLCPELDIASQGATIEEARSNLVEALTLFFETAGPTEVHGPRAFALRTKAWNADEHYPAERVGERGLRKS